MITCPSCHHQEVEGELFCSECGARLWTPGMVTPPTVTFDSGQLREPIRSQVGPVHTAEIHNLAQGQIALFIEGASQPIVLEGRREYFLGREAQEQQSPDVNFGSYGGREKGVSRRHASLRVDRRQLLLMDLGSSNGTQLNGSPLVAHEPVRLENGDEIRLGKLAFKVHFNL
jgi:pSer/pThr/pTyr-binding forkhead associated (FHA) protein